MNKEIEEEEKHIIKITDKETREERDKITDKKMITEGIGIMKEEIMTTEERENIDDLNISIYIK